MLSQSTIPSKKCTKCGETKPLTEFFFKNKERGTYQSHCKRCLTDASNARGAARTAARRAVKAAIPTPIDRLCTRCGETKALNDFSTKGKGRRDLRSVCKSCRAAERRERRKINPHTERAADAAYYEENKEMIRERERQWRKDHPFEAVAIARASRQKNAANRLAYNQTYRAANPDLYRLAYEKRRALQLSTADGTVTVEAWQEVVTYYGGCCAYCGQSVDVPEQEHMTPLSRDGTHTITNLVPACRTCNARKSDKTLIEYLMVS